MSAKFPKISFCPGAPSILNSIAPLVGTRKAFNLSLGLVPSPMSAYHTSKRSQANNTTCRIRQGCVPRTRHTRLLVFSSQALSVFNRFLMSLQDDQTTPKVYRVIWGRTAGQIEWRVHCREGVEYFEWRGGLELNTFDADSATLASTSRECFSSL